MQKVLGCQMVNIPSRLYISPLVGYRLDDLHDILNIYLPSRLQWCKEGYFHIFGVVIADNKSDIHCITNENKAANTNK